MKPNIPFSILLVLSLLIGIFTVTDYGESWDELKLYDYAADAQAAYRTWFEHGTIPVTGDRFENYGPFFVLLTRSLTRALTGLVPTVQEVDIQHFVYFLTFLLGVAAFYHLAARWLSRQAAFGATLLFMTQPVFWGHAFINPKDIPLLSLFLLSVVLGLRLHDLLLGPHPGSALASLQNRWRELSSSTRRQLTTALIAWGVLLLVLFGGTDLIHQWIEGTVRAAAGDDSAWLTKMIPRLQRVAPESYIERFFVLFLRLRAVVMLILTAVVIWLYRRSCPEALRLLGTLLPAGIALGLTVSIRIFGVWAGALVAGYFLWKSGRRAWLVMIPYAMAAILAMYFTWPYLWPDPVGHFWETVTIMAQHPWPGSVLFNGQMHPAHNLPAAYLPLLLAIQLTEPVWILFFIGLAVAIFGLWKDRWETRDVLALTFAWFILPAVTFVIVRPTLYDNFRQTLFILPPVFFMAGLALERVRKPAIQAAVVALIVLPGVIASIRLHPYEYVYYNQFLGGTQAAVDRFELEYWATSYREAAVEANRIAPPNANIWVDGPAHLFSRFARPDFHIYSPQEAERADHYDLVVTLARYDLEKTSFPEAPIVYRVIRDGAVFAVLRRP